MIQIINLENVADQKMMTTNVDTKMDIKPLWKRQNHIPAEEGDINMARLDS